MPVDLAKFLAACISVDLEVDPKFARLFAFAAVRGKRELVHKGAALDAALDRLEALCDQLLRCHEWAVVLPELVFDAGT